MWVVVDKDGNELYGPDSREECDSMYDTLGGYIKGWKVITVKEGDDPWGTTF